jgi:serine phosphatase RsbU (regulator of sigma subunit)
MNVTLPVVQLVLSPGEFEQQGLHTAGFREALESMGLTCHRATEDFHSLPMFRAHLTDVASRTGHPALVVISLARLQAMMQAVPVGTVSLQADAQELFAAPAKHVATVTYEEIGFSRSAQELAVSETHWAWDDFMHALQETDLLRQHALVLWVPHPLELDETRQALHTGFLDILDGTQTTGILLKRIVHLQHQHEKNSRLTERLQDLEHVHEEFRMRRLQMEKELDKTRVLQMSLLPPALQEDNEFYTLTGNPFSCVKLHHRNAQASIYGMYLPCDALGGDLYDLITFQDNTLGLLMSDVSGHGVPAAFVTAMVKSAFYKITHKHYRPDNVLFHLNNQLAGVVKTGDYSTALYIHLNQEERWLEFGGAGHPYPIHYVAETGRVERLEENGTPLVWVPDMPYLQQRRDLKSGDRILIFTDGLSELTNAEGDMFGEHRLCDAFQALVQTGIDGEELLESLLGILSEFAEGYPLQDDMTAMLIELH